VLLEGKKYMSERGDMPQDSHTPHCLRHIAKISDRRINTVGEKDDYATSDDRKFGV
jgi:hypothetical protein